MHSICIRNDCLQRKKRGTSRKCEIGTRAARASRDFPAGLRTFDAVSPTKGIRADNRCNFEKSGINS